MEDTVQEKIQQLYPLPIRELSLTGAYLAHDLRQFAISLDQPYIYANFVTSVDGRIATPKPRGADLTVPKAIANDRDWRLFQELAAQADLIISSGRYLRDWADGQAQEILQTDDPRYADLREWREAQGLKPLPDIAVISGSLDFDVPAVLTAEGRRAIFFTTATAPAERVRQLEAQSGRVIIAGERSVDGALLQQHLGELGYRIVYSAAGPRILYTLLRGQALNRLYVTYASRLLGGLPFSTLLEGPLLEPAVDLKMQTLYLDPAGLDSLGQLFVSYDIA